MVDLASHPSRRTVVKAGLWAAPAFAVVNLTAMSAAHASVATPPVGTEFISHAFAVFLVPTITGGVSVPTYYAFKFGEDGNTTVDTSINANYDGVFLSTTAPYASTGLRPTLLITGPDQGTVGQQATYQLLFQSLKVGSYSDATGNWITLLTYATSLVGVYGKDGTFGLTQVKEFFQVNGSYRLSK